MNDKVINYSNRTANFGKKSDIRVRTDIKLAITVKTTMKNAVILSLFLLSFVLLSSCSKDEDDKPQNPSNAFVLDGTTYSVKNTTISFQDRGSGITDASIVFSGDNGSKSAGITFLVRYFAVEGIEGTYTAGGGVPSAGNYASILSIYTVQGGSDGNSPEGDLVITSHGSDEYTISFDVTYATGVSASAEIRRKFQKL